jgi:hypothetical protein
MKITGNEPAMPRTYSHTGHNGKTIRQEFAMEFTATLIKHYSITDAVDYAIKAADHLIKSLNETPNPNL